MNKIRKELKDIYNVNDMQKAINAGCKSRDEEIKKADEAVHIMFIKYSKGQKEIKKLKDSFSNAYDAAMVYENRMNEFEAKNKKLRDQLSKLESHMGLPDKLLKDDK